ncbi:hypothetical protein [Parasynechococcus marenigrum]|nr:hypothetical protein [Parasynechococcus marenigrum]
MASINALMSGLIGLERRFPERGSFEGLFSWLQRALSNPAGSA